MGKFLLGLVIAIGTVIGCAFCAVHHQIPVMFIIGIFGVGLILIFLSNGRMVGRGEEHKDYRHPNLYSDTDE